MMKTFFITLAALATVIPARAVIILADQFGYPNGPLVGAPTELKPKNPIDIAKDLKAPVLGLYGGADQGIPIDTVDKMREAMRAAKKPGDLIVYPDTPHAFNADYRPSYRKAQAEEGWQRMLSWFQIYL